MKTINLKPIDRLIWLIDKASCNKLTSWEENFLESISEQLTLKGTLSDKQMEVLNRIADK